MKCPKCNTYNPETRKFCRECGRKLLLKCPKCNSENLPGDKFCGECGHDFRKPSEAPPKILSFDEKLNKIQKYLPKGLTEKILSQKDRIEGERKQVTVMFCDMEGFTSLSEKLGPEEAYTVMDQVYEILIHKVHDYEGTVNEFTGDGIMALFGAPIALEDAPQRAIRSSYGIHREMIKFNDKIKQEKENIPPIKMRIGIHTGPVVVGTLGNDLRVEFKAVGDTVNLASRLEGLALPGSTYVSEDTFKLTEGLFRFEALGEYAVKGRAESVKAYRVIAPSSSRTRFDVSAERGLTPFVGRERELELLLDGFERSKTGRGQAFSIVSEAGVGKSRLLYEFRKAVANEDVIFQEGKCLSYSKGVAYHPVIDIVKANFDIVEGDGDVETREKLKRGLKILNADEAQMLPYLLELLGVKDSGVDAISLSPEGRKDRIIQALNRIVIEASQIRPLIMAIEDLHWIDKSSEDAFKALLNSIAGARVFLIFTYRPEHEHTWGTKSYHSQITLNRLSDRESLTMVTHLLDTENIDKDLESLAEEKAEGVPFFIEEFIKSLKELKIIERKNHTYHLSKDIQSVTIPSTIHDIIMARVDKLPLSAKEMLQIGSVIEREFSYDLVKKVSGLPDQEIQSRLSVLKDTELLFARGISSETIYIFRHSLIRDVIYDSVLTRKKKKLHEDIGNAIEKLYKDKLVEHYGVMTEHYICCGNYEKAAKYSMLEARRVRKAASIKEAIIYTHKRIDCIEKLPQTHEMQKQLIDARTNLGLYYTEMNRYSKTKTAVEPIVDLAIKIGDKRRISQINTIIGAYYLFVMEDFPRAFNQLNDALKVSDEVKDFVSMVFACYYLGMAHCFSCQYKKAYSYLKQAVDIVVAAKSTWAVSTNKSTESINFNWNGKLILGSETSKEALRLAEESGDIFPKAIAHTAYGFSCYCEGILEKAKKHLLMAAKIYENINVIVWNGFTQLLLGETFFEIEEYQKSMDHYRELSFIFDHNKLFPSWSNLSKIGITKAKVLSGVTEIQLEPLIKYVYTNKIKTTEGSMRRYIAEILLNSDYQNISEAEAWIKKAIEKDKKNEMIFYLARDYALYAELFKRKGNLPKAKDNLNKAIDIFKDCEANGWAKKYEKELEAL